MFFRKSKEKAEIETYREIFRSISFYKIPQDLDFKKIYTSKNREYLLVMGRCFFEIGKLDEAEKLILKASQISRDEYSFFNLLKIAYIKKDFTQLKETYNAAMDYFTTNPHQAQLEQMFHNEYVMMENRYQHRANEIQLPLSFYDVIDTEKILSYLVLQLEQQGLPEISEELNELRSLDQAKALTEDIYERQTLRSQSFKEFAMKYGKDLSDVQKAILFDSAHTLMDYYVKRAHTYEPIAPYMDNELLFITR